MAEPEQSSRRDFGRTLLRWGLALAGLLALKPLYDFLTYRPGLAREVKFTAEEMGGGVRVKAGAVLVSGEGQPRVFSARCPHLGCLVGWDAVRGRLVCPCHGSEYDLAGQVLAGPAPRPLERLEHKPDQEGGLSVLVPAD